MYFARVHTQMNIITINIYKLCDEALFLYKPRPSRKASKLFSVVVDGFRGEKNIGVTVRREKSLIGTRKI